MQPVGYEHVHAFSKIWTQDVTPKQMELVVRVELQSGTTRLWTCVLTNWPLCGVFFGFVVITV